MNTTIVVALITFLSAIIPVSIKEYFDYKKELKLVKYKEETLIKRQVVIDFINATNECICTNGTIPLNELSKFQKCANTLLLYFPEIKSKDIDSIADILRAPDMRAKDEELRPLIKKLSKSLFEN